MGFTGTEIKEKGIRGINLKPFLTEESAPSSRPLIWYLPQLNEDAVVQDGGFKFVRNKKSYTPELYNLKQDPKETNNLYQELPEKAKQLEKILDDYLLLHR
jgi:arylsulfatase A-like enzyme